MCACVVMEKEIEKKILNKKQLLQTVSNIKEKFENLKRDKFLLEEGQQSLFKPIVEPLKSINENLQQKKVESEKVMGEAAAAAAAATNTETKFEEKVLETDKKIFKQNNKDYSYQYPIKKNSSISWGVSVNGKDKKGNPKYEMTLSKFPVKFTKNLIIARGKEFKRTRALYNLLTSRQNLFGATTPIRISPQDEADYVEFLRYTGDLSMRPPNTRHGRAYLDRGRFENIIQKYDEEEQENIKEEREEELPPPPSPDVSPKEGGTLLSKNCSRKRRADGAIVPNNFAKINKLNPKLEFIWYDNLNEMVERYKLLLAAHEAGNTGVINEILAIREELEELGITEK